MINTTATVQAALAWTQLDTQALTRISDIGSVGMDEAVINGSGDSQINMLWHDVITIPSGSTVSYNMQSLIRNIFNQDVTVGFQKVRAISIKNQSEDAGAFLFVHATGIDGLTGIFGGSTGRGVIHPKCSILFPNIIQGWTINSTHRTLSIQDAAGSGCSIEIAVIGVSGSGG